MNDDDKEGTRGRILLAALELFARKGYEAAGVQEIADAAGIAKPALYYYFGNKQGILEALVAEFGDDLAGKMQAAAIYQHDIMMNLRALLDAVLEFSRKQPPFFRLMVSLFSAAPETSGWEAAASLRKNLVALITALFAAAARDHGNMKGRQHLYGETFFALLQSCGILALNGELSLTDKTIRYRIIHQFMHGIFS
ncbi:MAG: TetR/AcrR family transcriptional regulator [Treponema sp.]|jgi:TetR/AcrR family transcriptional regulator|nr:TetR/AcrR family transcriptional regulator [Treponema sp.]